MPVTTNTRPSPTTIVGDRRRRANCPNPAVTITATVTAISQTTDGERSQNAAQTTPTAAGNSQRRRGVRRGSGDAVGNRSLGARAKTAPQRRAERLRQAVYSVKRFLHTLRPGSRLALAGGLLALSGRLQGQAAAATPLLDALSITVQLDSATVARGSMRFRQFRTGNDLELVITGIIVRRGQRVTAELRTDSAFVLRKYVAESRDSAGKLIDRVRVTSAGGRITLERVTPARRMVREYLAQRDLMILDSAAVVPFVALAGLVQRTSSLTFLDVRRGTLSAAQLTLGAPVELSVADIVVSGSPVSVAGLTTSLSWWRDARGRLLRVVWGGRSRVLRDDPPT